MTEGTGRQRCIFVWQFVIALVGTNLKASFALRGAFWLQAIFMALNNFLYFVFWWIFFDRFEEVAGWHVEDMLALFGIVAAGFGITAVFAGGIHDLALRITEGDLDAYLTQPKNPLLFAVAAQSRASGWGDIASGAGLIFVSGLVDLHTLPIALLAVAISASVFIATGVLLHSLAFWLGRVDALVRQLWEFQIMFSSYPSPLFSGALRLVLFSVIPAGFIGYLPVSLLRDFEWTNLGAAVGGACVYILLAIVVFEAGLRRYESGNRFGVRT